MAQNGRTVNPRGQHAPPVRVTRGDVQKFTNECVVVWSLHRHLMILYEEGDARRRNLLWNTAPILFGDLGSMLKMHVILKICALLDKSRTGKRDNLTADFFVENCQRIKSARDRRSLKARARSMGVFRQKLKRARDKYISHLDLKSIRRGRPLGAAKVARWDRFWRDLRDFLRILHHHYLPKNGEFDLLDIAGPSDADLLIKALKESIWFRDLIGNGLADRIVDVAMASEYWDA